MLSPVKFTINFKTVGVPDPSKIVGKIKNAADIKVFMSAQNKEPNEQNNDKVATNVCFKLCLYFI